MQLENYSPCLLIPLVPFAVLLVLQSVILYRPNALILRQVFAVLSLVYSASTFTANVLFMVDIYAFFEKTTLVILSFTTLCFWFVTSLAYVVFVAVLLYSPSTPQDGRGPFGKLKLCVVCVCDI